MRSLARPAFALAFALSLAPTARAEQGFALQLLEPTPVGDRFWAVPDGSVDGPATPRFGLMLNYAYKPLKLVDSATRAEIPNGALVRHQLFLHVGGSVSLFDRVKIDFDLPLALRQIGDDPMPSFARPTGGKLADVRLGARLALYGRQDDPFALGLALDLWLPAGTAGDFLSDGKVRLNPKVAASGRIGSVAYAADLGYLARDNRELPLAVLGHSLNWGVAAGWLFADGDLQIGPEVYGRVGLPFKSPADPRDWVIPETPVEALLGLKYWVGEFMVGAGLGTALTQAPGAGAVRAVATLAWVPRPAHDRDGDGVGDDWDACPDVRGVASENRAVHGCPPADSDGDGIGDEKDACPSVRGVASADPRRHGCPEPVPSDRDGDGVPDAHDACPDQKGEPSPDSSRNGCPRTDRDGDGVFDEDDACLDVPGVASAIPALHGCPKPDRDGDGVPDEKDACPDERGAAHDDPVKNGCPVPADRDGDGLADEQDACPDQKGEASDDPTRNGCPPPADRDGDGVPDAHDACPDQKGEASTDPAKHGCPRSVEVSQEQIFILKPILFETGKATLLKESDAILSEVADVLRAHLEILKVSIEGHTDSKGDKPRNIALSKRRAETVQQWLVKRGKVDARRLETAGFGPERPIDSNLTEAGRSRNRRVEFKILERAKK